MQSKEELIEKLKDQKKSAPNKAVKEAIQKKIDAMKGSKTIVK